MSRYYSQRTGAAGNARQLLGKGFWYAYKAAFEEMGRKNWFCETFGSECSDGHPVSWSDEKIRQLLEANFGQIVWPREKTNAPEEFQILDLVEFFYSYVSYPEKCWFHHYCGDNHPEKYDQSKGRYEYTILVNKLFERFNQPYKLEKGKVRSLRSEILDAEPFDLELPIEDEHLRGLIGRGLEHFYNKNEDHKLDGLRCLVDAYERLKTLDDPTNKKRSTEKLAKRLAVRESLINPLNSLFRELTLIGNEYTIRHHEYGKKVLDDRATIEFLFYSYYNLLRFIIIGNRC